MQLKTEGPEPPGDGGQQLAGLALAVAVSDNIVCLCRLRDYADLRAEAAGGGTKCGSDVGIISAP
jgi:hypothetical protein